MFLWVSLVALVVFRKKLGTCCDFECLTHDFLFFDVILGTNVEFAVAVDFAAWQLDLQLA